MAYRLYPKNFGTIFPQSVNFLSPRYVIDKNQLYNDMKKIVFTVLAMAALVACQSNNKQGLDDGEAVEIVGTDSTGLVDIFAYEGVVPAESGKSDSIDYLVIITQQIDTVNGVYQLTQTYVTADGKAGQQMSSKGKKIFQRGTPQNKMAKVYKLVPDSGSNQTVNLLVESDTTVVLLDNQMNAPAKPDNHRLKAVKRHKL